VVDQPADDEVALLAEANVFVDGHLACHGLEATAQGALGPWP
jgi:hypothetical protein